MFYYAENVFVLVAVVDLVFIAYGLYALRRTSPAMPIGLIVIGSAQIVMMAVYSFTDLLPNLGLRILLVIVGGITGMAVLALIIGLRLLFRLPPDSRDASNESGQ